MYTKAEKLLKSLLGDDGFETLSKTMYRRDSKSILSPIDMYLPILAVPRTILSWLVASIKPMRPGDEKILSYPGLDNLKIQVNKTGIDAYTAQFVKGGHIVHSFENQTLPAFGGHLMSMTEDYDGKKVESNEVPAALMSASDIHMPPMPQSDTAINAMVEVTKILGKVIDRIMDEKFTAKAVEEAKEKIEKAGMHETGSPSGHAAPNGPVAPLKATAPSRDPKASMTKQVTQQTKGQTKADTAQNPAMIQHKLNVAATKPAKPASTPATYFRNYLTKAQLEKKEPEVTISESDLYSPCPHCKTPEFTKSESGPKYSPCACFYITSQENKNKAFLRLSKTSGGYKISFSSKADPEIIEAFVETLKTKLNTKYR